MPKYGICLIPIKTVGSIKNNQKLTDLSVPLQKARLALTFCTGEPYRYKIIFF